jgi:hypothetical protein
MMQATDISAFDDNWSEFEIPPVVGPIVDRAGRVVEVNADVWTFDDDHAYISLDWGGLPIGDGPFRRSLQHYIADAAGSQAPHSLGNAFQIFKHCLKLVPGSFWKAGYDASPSLFEDRAAAWLRKVVASLREKNRLWRLQIVRQWYTYCVEIWQDLGFSAEAALMLDGIKIPNNPTGVNVHSSLPNVGPLTSQEMQALNMALEADECHEHRSIQERAAVTLCMPIEKRSAYAKARVSTIHVTPAGLCAHDFSQIPCPLHGECGDGCGDLLQDAEAEKIEFLEFGIELMKEQIAYLEKAAEKKLYQASRALDYQRKQLDSYMRELARIVNFRRRGEDDKQPPKGHPSQ